MCVLNVYVVSDEENFITQGTRSDRNIENSNISRMIKSRNAMYFTCSTHKLLRTSEVFHVCDAYRMHGKSSSFRFQPRSPLLLFSRPFSSLPWFSSCFFRFFYSLLHHYPSYCRGSFYFPLLSGFVCFSFMQGLGSYVQNRRLSRLNLTALIY